MRRQSPISEIPDSDQSISEDEESDDFCLETAVSLDPSAKNQEELPLPVLLDFLRGASKRSLDGNGSSSSFEKPTVVHEDEVELPDFDEVEVNRLSGEIAANSSDEEAISEDGVVVLSLKERLSFQELLLALGPKAERSINTVLVLSGVCKLSMSMKNMKNYYMSKKVCLVLHPMMLPPKQIDAVMESGAKLSQNRCHISMNRLVL